jgi:catechol 1,2-dioxygenase
MSRTVLLKLMDRSPMRPAHIHLMITHPEYATVINQIYLPVEFSLLV